MLILAFAPLLVAAAMPGSALGGPSWSARASATTLAEARSFRSEGITLAGTLYIPEKAKSAPAVVVFHAASSPSRDEALYDHLKQMLPPLGIAVFVYDRRGTGSSGGSAKGNAFELLAADGIEAAKMLARDPRIDSRRIGFWGLSQGGWLSLLAASRYKPTAFAVAISAPMVAPDVQMNFAVANILRIKGYSNADIDLAIAARTAVDNFERGLLDRPTAQARLDAIVDKPWFDLTYMDKTISDPAKSGWAKELAHDPLTSIGDVSAPTLIMYGSVDPWVPAASSVDRLRMITPDHPNFEVAVISGADHMMMTSASPEKQVDPAFFPRQAPDSTEYFGRLAAWLQRRILAR
jgi:alpha-beta hydrolase superfamily lysophospholipase